MLVTTDGQNRRGKVVPVKVNADEACSGENKHRARYRGGPHQPSDPVAHAEVPGLRVATSGTMTWWTTSPTPTPTSLHDAEDPLFIIYTSGTTGKPKGLVHTMGGYLGAERVHPRSALRFLPVTWMRTACLRPDELKAVGRQRTPKRWSPPFTGAPPTCVGYRAHLRNLRPAG